MNTHTYCIFTKNSKIIRNGAIITDIYQQAFIMERDEALTLQNTT